jgi:hypothetical protein
MSDIDLRGKWYLTPKTFEFLGIDMQQIQILANFPLEEISEEAAQLTLFLQSHLDINGDKFKIYFANPEKNKLKVIRKGKITGYCEDKKGRPCLCFVSKDGEEGKFKLKKGILKDSTSPFEFQRAKPKGYTTITR